ncbi:MAG: MFS transporter, partial [Eggerthellaceae bacterium]|nr:MFS transporter [Eggerthellaceae bacterium]
MPIAGVLIDAIHLKKSRFRHWMVVGGILYFVGGTLLFMKLNMPPAAYAVMFCLFFFIYWLGYSLAWSSFRALMDPICATNPMDKVGLTAAASQEGVVARVIFSFIATAVLGIFAGNVALGYTAVNGLFGLIAVICLIIVSMVVKPYDTITEGYTDEQIAEAAAKAKAAKAARPKMSGKDFWNTVKTRPMLVFLLCVIFRCAVQTIYSTLLVYYLGYVLNAADLTSVYMMIAYAVSFLGALLVEPVAKRLGKRGTFVWTTLASAAVLLLLLLSKSPVFFIVIMSIFHLLSIIGVTLIAPCMADIGEYNAMKNGSQAKGFTFSIGGMAIQVSAVIGAAVAAFGMVAVGFDVSAVTAAGIQGLQNLYIWGVAIVSVISALLFLLYPLTEKKMAELRAEYAEKGSISL